MGTEHFRCAALAVALIAPCAAARADDVSMPNVIDTPGAVDHAATWNVICNGTTRDRRHVTAAMKAEVLAAYNIPRIQGSFYEIDHLVPLAIGGANVVANLWPQPWAEADQKDVLEVDLQRRVCHGLLGQAEAQHEIAEDWTAAYARYVGGRLVAAPDPGPVATSAPAKEGAPQSRSMASRASVDPGRAMSAFAALIILAATGAPAPVKATHADEIKALAGAVAIARTVRESCPGIVPDDRFLEALRLRLHFTDADRPAFAPQARAAADVLAKARDEAPTRQAWCDAVFRLYGPQGEMMRGLLAPAQN